MASNITTVTAVVMWNPLERGCPRRWQLRACEHAAAGDSRAPEEAVPSVMACPESAAQIPSSLAKDDDVLDGQHLDSLDPLQGKLSHFLADLRHGHFVQRLDRHFRILSAKLDKHHPPARFQGPNHRLDH